ncbi:restriction endonuclease subunit S [Brevibacillus agri]|uniref:restriction endonuclease subunit S n=1 Tax=Brevibacillus agri TaxID=51101 RepID=UPI0030F43CF7
MSFENWNEVELGRLIESISVTHSLSNDKVIFLNTSDILEGRVLHQNYSSVKGLPGQAKKSIKKHDILFSEIRPANKRFAYIDFDADDYVVSTKLMVLRRVSEQINNRFLYLILTSKEMLDYLQGVAEFRSGTFPQITFNELRKIKISLPPAEEQVGICNVIESIQGKIELNNAINKNLEEMAQALFKRWFIDFEFPNENGEPYKSSGGEFEESELGMIPKGWKLTQLEELIDINPKRVLKKGECKPYVEMKNIQNNYARVSKYVMREYNSGSKFSNGDVLFARITPCLENGKTAYVDFLKGNEVGWGSTEFLVLRSRPGIPSEFTYFLARSDQFRSHAILSMTGSSGRQRVPESSLRNYRVPLPVTPDLILAFGEVVKSTLNLMKRNDDESNRLIQIRDTLLPKLMSGEIRVPVDQESPQATTRQIVAEENESYNAT